MTPEQIDATLTMVAIVVLTAYTICIIKWG